ncbi:MAG: alpha/beta hydrolase [Candidatus Geothermincolia bacterium]
MNNNKKTPLRETGIFPHFYKFFMTLVEFLFKPIINLHPPDVRAHIRNVPYVKPPAHRNQRLDIVIPQGKGPFPILIYVHGGGFISMDKSHYTRMSKTFAAAGYLVFNVNYRRAPSFRYPTNLTDVARAVSWVLANARAYRGNTGTIFLAGDSAGAHLVSTYTSALFDPLLAKAFRMEGLERPEHVSGLVLLYGAFDCETTIDTGFPFVSMMLHSFLSRDPVVFKERARNASPLRHITPNYPPCFITYAERDTLAPESVAFARELESKGVEREVMSFPPSECIIIPHGFVSTFWRKCARKAMAGAIAFMNRHA